MAFTISFFFLLLWLLLTFPPFLHSLPAPREFPLSCGATDELTHGNLKYIPDEGFITVGNKSTLKTPGLLPLLSSLRYFPDTKARKYCYEFPAIKGGKYLVRSTYYYGGFDGGTEPPVFDQIIQGTKWSTVNTTEDHANGLSTYYEIIVVSELKILSFCLARNKRTSSSPFINALELEYLDESLYNSTDFSKFALTTLARHSFGSHGNIIGYPDDEFNRFWQPFMDKNPVVEESHSDVHSSDFWNYPPTPIFTTAITSSRGQPLTLEWPAATLLPVSKYYIALYFHDNRTPSPFSWRVFTVSINGKVFYDNLNVTTRGVSVYARDWPLAGQTEITLTPADNSPVGPMINGGELFQIMPLAGRTLTRDVIAMEDLARSFDNPPSDWSGDPCLPAKNSWTGVKCSRDRLARVVTLDLTGMGISGSLPSSIGNLSAITHLWLGENKLSGPIPDLSAIKDLQTLHLDNNEFEGSIPPSLGLLKGINEIFLQNNKLAGKIPPSLLKNININLKVSPGNHLSS
ncbi:putative leucine-rich repeat receptor-like serine/threonine-protein kinase At2g14440 [Mercurialis annua]|uniref:putative leucine-rich repeat receptor-like serine/threonine-protein kinase At2g14440 n=1 Tax=Mercurialis annua TaxID=3986 RepID=UPI00215F59B0|nr:putative leucine-rich repeat receptor-like serine/threonine-protein kinase At2g14440 [Mercurialis annua]